MGLAPILVERNFEIIQQVHASGVAMLDRRAECKRVALDRRPRLRPLDRPARARGQGRGPARERRSEKGLPWPLAPVRRRALPLALPDLRAARLHQLVLAGRALGLRARGLRRLPDGWDERGAPWDYWVERTETARVDVCAARRRRGRRRRRHDLAVRRASARSRAPSTSRVRPQDRDQRLRVPDDRPDLARAGAARCRGRARSGRGRRDSGRAVRRGDRRADGGRLDRRRSATGTARGSTSRRSRGSRTSAARSSCSTRTRRSARIRSTSRELGVDVLAAGVLKYLLGSAGLGFLWTRPGLAERAAADADGLVRRPRTSSRWTSTTTRRRRRRGGSSRARRRSRRSTPASPAMELMMEIGIAETREHVNALNERLIAGVDELGGVVVTPRDAEHRGALVCIRSTDAPALVRRLGEDGIVTSERDGNLRVSAHAYNTRGGHRPRPAGPRHRRRSTAARVPHLIDTCTQWI